MATVPDVVVEVVEADRDEDAVRGRRHWICDGGRRRRCGAPVSN
jgi:hypothetical protein